MATITDFDAWLDSVDPDDYKEVYCLYKSVEECEEWGMYSTSENNGKLFVKGPVGDTLMLASEKAKKTFLNILEDRYCDDGMDIESWYGFMRAMKNDKA